MAAACPSCGAPQSTYQQTSAPITDAVPRDAGRRRTPAQKFGVGCAGVLVGLIVLVLALAIIGGNEKQSGTQSTPTPQQPFPGLYEQGRLSDSSIGCANFKDWERLAQLARENDKAAFQIFWATKVLSGDCSSMNPGTIVTVEDTGILSGTLCVRPQGTTECLWTANSVVKRLPAH
jgi:hypothetical protein